MILDLNFLLLDASGSSAEVGFVFDASSTPVPGDHESYSGVLSSRRCISSSEWVLFFLEVLPRIQRSDCRPFGLNIHSFRLHFVLSYPFVCFIRVSSPSLPGTKQRQWSVQPVETSSLLLQVRRSVDIGCVSLSLLVMSLLLPLLCYCYY